MNTASVVSVEATTAPQTSCVPLTAAVEARLAQLVVAVDVLQHDDRVVHEHADGERQTGEADDVERAAQQAEQQEGADDADRESPARRRAWIAMLRRKSSSTRIVRMPPSRMFCFTRPIAESMYSVSS